MRTRLQACFPAIFAYCLLAFAGPSLQPAYALEAAPVAASGWTFPALPDSIAAVFQALRDQIIVPQETASTEPLNVADVAEVAPEACAPAAAPKAFDPFDRPAGISAAPALDNEDEMEAASGVAPLEATFGQADSTALQADPLIVNTIRAFNGEMTVSTSQHLASLIEETAGRYSVDPYLVTALVSQESAFHPDAVSYVGAQGLGQLMPETAADLGVDIASPEQNLDGCVRYLAQNLDLWASTQDPVALALASYNAGAGNVESYGGVPPFEETQNYVSVIKERYAALRSGNALSGV
jgi:soluble lytic murein transglycosylase-like protein